MESTRNIFQFYKSVRRALLFLIPLIICTSCYWENEETFYPGSAECDTTAVSFAQDIVPILTSNCLTCHSNTNAPDLAFGIAFEDYEDIAASSGMIIGAINHLEGYPQMPKNREKLDVCLINTFEAWVNQGSPDN
jgi:hypothetical protein